MMIHKDRNGVLYLLLSRCLLDSCYLVVVGLICLTPTMAHGQVVDKAVTAVFEDWKFRQGIMKSVRYVLKGSTEFRDEHRPSGADPIQPRHGILLLDLVKHRYHYEYSEGVKIEMGHHDNDPQQWQYTQRSHTTAFDGKRYQSLRNRKANGIEEDLDDLHISQGKMSNGSVFDPLLNPIFFAHGFVGTVHKGVVIDDWPISQDLDDFRNRGHQRFRGNNLLVLRTDPFSIGGSGYKAGALSDEFWINPEQKSAIERYFYLSGTNPWYYFEITWKESPYGWWVDEWSNTWSINNQIRRISRYKIESMEVNPEVTDADFTLKAEPGMKVTIAEESAPGKSLNGSKPISLQTYRISPSGTWIELSPDGVPLRNGLSWFVWIGTITGCCFLALLWFLIRRRNNMATN